MAIVPLDKITIYGATSSKDRVVARLQDLGCMHLVNLGSAEAGEASRGDVSTDARRALKYLNSCAEQRRQVRREEEFDGRRVVAEALELERLERDLGDERDLLRKAIPDLAPWGEFRLPPGGAIGGVRFWFYELPIHDLDKFAETDLVWREAARDHRFAYIVVLSRGEPDSVPATQVQLDPRPLSELQARLEAVEELLEDFHFRREGMTRWRELLEHDLNRADDAAARSHAARQSLDGRGVFALQGWAPRAARGAIEQFYETNHLAVTIEPPGRDDEPPTLLENPQQVAGGEGLVTFYKTPQYGTWDPSGVVYYSFAIFFAMILADAGYAALLGLVLARLWKNMGATEGGRRGRRVFGALVGFSLVYGVIGGSYFGFSPSEDSILGKLRILDVESQAVMMPLSVGIGVVHLSLANIVTAWLHRGRAVALSSLGWLAVLLGASLAGIGLFSQMDKTLAGRLVNGGGVVLVTGLIAVFLFSSERPLFSLSLKNHALRIFDGLAGLTGVSGLFGDVLSYLRLFALGLSSARLAQTFNGLAQSAWDTAGFGVLLGIAILIFGHTLNLLLSLMSGVVHGLRLNVIEFFKWSLPDEGYLFHAFAKKARP